MNDETTILLHSQVKALAKQFAGKYEAGIDVEIPVILRRRAEIQEFHVSWQQEGYWAISIFLKAFHYETARNIFEEFVQLIEYRDATLYAEEREADAVHCIFASLTKSGLRFVCLIDFSQYLA